MKALSFFEKKKGARTVTVKELSMQKTIPHLEKVCRGPRKRHKRAKPSP